MESITIDTTMNDLNKHTKLHIAMLPWLAFGHMLPFLELAKLIAGKGHRVSFISTPRNIDRFPPLPPSLSTLITFVKIPLPHNPDLPKDAEATSDLVTEQQLSHLKNAYDSLQDPIVDFLKSSNPDWLLFDFASYWVPKIAKPLGTPTSYFCIFLAAAITFMGPTSAAEALSDERSSPKDYTRKPNWVPFETNVAWRLFEVRRMFKRLVGDEFEADSVSDMYRFMQTLRSCDMIAIRSCEEFEPEWLRVLEVIHGKTVVPVGVLSTQAESAISKSLCQTYACSLDYQTNKFSEPTNNSGENMFDIEISEPLNNVIDNDTWRDIKDWLDKQSKNTVVYVAFGSEATLSQKETTEIALGLEKSGFPFFWVLRAKNGDEASTKLPEGFEERNQEKGVVCRRWIPQVKILGHDSLGVFLSHSGWSSVVEALTFGRPLVLFPLSNDQGLNARCFMEKKVGYELPRDEEDGSFTSEAVAEAVRMMIEKEKGKVYREKVKELRSLFGSKERQDAYVNKFLEYLLTHKNVMFE